MINRKKTFATEKELSTLINESSRDNFLMVSFGGRLDDCESNDWAFKRVQEMRDLAKGEMVVDGCGI